MFYLITDQDNKTWRNIQWGENITHEEENSNYHFIVYNSPLVASYMNPCYEGIKNPKLWTANAENLSRDDGFRSKFAKLTTISEHQIELPTNEQRINFGILCALNVAKYQPFNDWAFKYLRGEDQSKESAQKLNDELIAKLDAEAEEDYTACCFAVLASVTLEDSVFAANAAHRAYHDSLDFAEPINLDQVAQITNMVSAKDIANLLE
jgi:hypothetical protein